MWQYQGPGEIKHADGIAHQEEVSSNWSNRIIGAYFKNEAVLLRQKIEWWLPVVRGRERRVVKWV